VGIAPPIVAVVMAIELDVAVGVEVDVKSGIEETVGIALPPTRTGNIATAFTAYLPLLIHPSSVWAEGKGPDSCPITNDKSLACGQGRAYHPNELSLPLLRRCLRVATIRERHTSETVRKAS
jgi:hypothetical protein